MYAYARASLLHYARWMAEHEYPYLEKPEILEYPTETWAAQDMRKSEIFDYAARHTTGAERRALPGAGRVLLPLLHDGAGRDADADAVPAGGAAAVVRVSAGVLPSSVRRRAPGARTNAGRFRPADGLRAAEGAGQEARSSCLPGRSPPSSSWALSVRLSTGSHPKQRRTAPHRTRENTPARNRSAHAARRIGTGGRRNSFPRKRFLS